MSSKHSQEEIAKQFDLPERQSKIDTLLKEPEIYCICRTSDSTRFMICCDACEEWYHGDCVNITESESKDIHHYYCQWCIEKDSSLEIEYKKKSSASGHARDKSHKGERGKGGRGKKAAEKAYVEEKVKEKPEKAEKVKVKGCGACSGCLNRRDCGRCENCKKNRKKDWEKSKKRTCMKRICVEQTRQEKETAHKSVHKNAKEDASSVLTSRQIFTADDEEDDWVPPSSTTTVVKETKKPKSNRRSRKKVEAVKPRKPYVPKDSDASESSEEETPRAEPKQCCWYECLNPARLGSKYCSDQCGIRLATDRILRLLPGRIQEWNLTPSIAEEKNKKDLEDIRRKQILCRAAIEELESKRIALDAHIEKVQPLDMDPNADEEEVEEEEGYIPCVTCGHEVPIKSCIKHMERCYNKYESQTSFGSAVKTGIEGTPIFCDFYHPVHRTYCKRLKVLCPEHSKDPKIRDHAICGYPLIQNVTGPMSQICRVAKKKCNRHYCWEKMRRAEIDLEKVRYWLKLDALLDQERQCKQALTNRAGVLGLLLHSTFDHDLREKIQKQMAEAELQQKLADEEKTNPKKESPEPDLDYSNFEMKETSPTKQNRQHRKAQPSKSAAPQSEEVTAAKMFKQMSSSK